MTSLVIRDERMAGHDPGPGHPESPARLMAIESALESSAQIIHEAPTPAERRHVEHVHSARHIDAIDTFDQRGGIIDGDTVLSSGSVQAAWLAAGACIQAVDGVMDGRADSAIALVRPPGHHAEPDRAMGFCFFSNVAIAAEYAQRERGCERVLIVDWDVHHGNGTQAAFYPRDDVYFFSVHQSPLYPGTGQAVERGAGAGVGYTLNVPLPAGLSDPTYHALFRDGLTEVAARFKPDLVLVSAGFDAHRSDPLAQMNVTTDGFAAICGITNQIAREYADGRIVMALEGGYHLEALGRSVRACVDVLNGATPPAIGAAGRTGQVVVDYVRRHVKQTEWSK